MKRYIQGTIILLLVTFTVTDGTIGYSGFSEFSANFTPFILTVLSLMSLITIGMLAFVYIIVRGVDNAVSSGDEYLSIVTINNQLTISNKIYFYFKQIVYILLSSLLASYGFLYSAFALLAVVILTGISRMAIRGIRNHSVNLEEHFEEHQLHQLNDNN